MFDWQDFINLVQELIYKHKTNYDEALYRTIISRAYYGIFKQVEDYLKPNVSLPDKDDEGNRLGSHERVIDFLRNHSNSQVKRFGKKLNELKKLRRKADYTATEKISRVEAIKAIDYSIDLSKKWKDTIINLI